MENRDKTKAKQWQDKASQEHHGKREGKTREEKRRQSQDHHNQDNTAQHKAMAKQDKTRSTKQDQMNSRKS